MKEFSIDTVYKGETFSMAVKIKFFKDGDFWN